MCGIYLRITKSNSGPELSAFTEFNSIQHRGPDNSFFISKKLYLGDELLTFHFGFHRLIINDLSDAGNQPFTYSDGSFSMCNGEIYNFAALKQRYLSAYPLKSHSDCEVIFPLYEIHHTEMLPHLDGVFAFIIYSAKERALFIARDPVGERPLYIGATEDSFIVSSELKSTVHPMAQQFPPGCYCKIDQLTKTIRFIPYFTYPSETNHTISFADAITTTKKYLFEAVEKRLLSDVPVGSLLSGGIDSGGVTAIAAQLYKHKLHTFTIGLPGSEEDLKYAKFLADYLGTIHHEIIVSVDEALAIVDSAVRVIETFNPVLIPNHILIYFLAKYIREKTGVRVLLDGTGPDEILGGYKFFAEAPSAEEFAAETINQIQDLHKTELMAERAIAAFGLETRSPYLDKQLITHLMQLPTEFKLPSSTYTQFQIREKYLLRKVLEELLPREIVNRPKIPMPEGASKNFLTLFENKIIGKVDDNAFHQQQQRFPHLKKTEYYYRHVFYDHFPWARNVICGVKYNSWRKSELNSVIPE